MSKDDHESAFGQDAEYPLPPDESIVAGQTNEPDPLVVAPPAVVVDLAVPRVRHVFKVEAEALKLALAQLKRIELGEQVDLGHVSIDALVCGATLTRYPIDENLPKVVRLRERARNGQLHKYHPYALDELEDALAVIEAALVALKAISALDERIPGTWSNLHPMELARKINGVGHTLLRGRIAGMNI